MLFVIFASSSSWGVLEKTFTAEEEEYAIRGLQDSHSLGVLFNKDLQNLSIQKRADGWEYLRSIWGPLKKIRFGPFSTCIDFENYMTCTSQHQGSINRNNSLPAVRVCLIIAFISLLISFVVTLSGFYPSTWAEEKEKNGATCAGHCFEIFLFICLPLTYLICVIVAIAYWPSLVDPNLLTSVKKITLANGVDFLQTSEGVWSGDLDFAYFGLGGISLIYLFGYAGFVFGGKQCTGEGSETYMSSMSNDEFHDKVEKVVMGDELVVMGVNLSLLKELLERGDYESVADAMQEIEQSKSIPEDTCDYATALVCLLAALIFLMASVAMPWNKFIINLPPVAGEKVHTVGIKYYPFGSRCMWKLYNDNTSYEWCDNLFMFEGSQHRLEAFRVVGWFFFFGIFATSVSFYEQVRNRMSLMCRSLWILSATVAVMVSFFTYLVNGGEIKFEDLFDTEKNEFRPSLYDMDFTYPISITGCDEKLGGYICTVKEGNYWMAILGVTFSIVSLVAICISCKRVPNDTLTRTTGEHFTDLESSSEGNRLYGRPRRMSRLHASEFTVYAELRRRAESVPVVGSLSRISGIEMGEREAGADQKKKTSKHNYVIDKKTIKTVAGI